MFCEPSFHALLAAVRTRETLVLFAASTAILLRPSLLRELAPALGANLLCRIEFHGFSLPHFIGFSVKESARGNRSRGRFGGVSDWSVVVGLLPKTILDDVVAARILPVFAATVAREPVEAVINTVIHSETVFVLEDDDNAIGYAAVVGTIAARNGCFNAACGIF